MSDSIPADVPLDEQEEPAEQSADGAADLDERGEGLDKRGGGTETTPANPISGDAGLSSDG